MTRPITFVLTVSCLSSASFADIGFPAAVIGCRSAVPQATLFGVELRERNGMLLYEGDLYDQALVTNWDPRLNMDTGALLEIDIDTPDQSNLADLAWIFAHMGDVSLDFADAIDAAADSSTGSGLQKIQLDREEGILAYQLEYFDLSKLYVDAATGGIIPHHSSSDDHEETLSEAQFNSCIGAAAAAVGAGWTSFESEAEDESSSSLTAANRVEVRFFETKGSGVRQVTVDLGGAVLSNIDYTPTPSQASRIESIRSLLGSLTVGMAEAVTTAIANYPLATVHEAELKVEQGGLMWKVELVTAALVEIDAWVDASQAAFRFAAAPVNANPSDLNEDGLVDGADLGALVSLWGATNPTVDVDGDSLVGGAELGTLLTVWTNP